MFQERVVGARHAPAAYLQRVRARVAWVATATTATPEEMEVTAETVAPEEGRRTPAE
jgi:hypothetical protein